MLFLKKLSHHRKISKDSYFFYCTRTNSFSDHWPIFKSNFLRPTQNLHRYLLTLHILAYAWAFLICPWTRSHIHIVRSHLKRHKDEVLLKFPLHYLTLVSFISFRNTLSFCMYYLNPLLPRPPSSLQYPIKTQGVL